MPNTKMAETTGETSCASCASLQKELGDYRQGAVIITNELEELKSMLQKVLTGYQDSHRKVEDQNRRLEEINKKLVEKLLLAEEKLKIMAEYAVSTRDNATQIIKNLSL